MPRRELGGGRRPPPRPAAARGRGGGRRRTSPRPGLPPRHGRGSRRGPRRARVPSRWGSPHGSRAAGRTSATAAVRCCAPAAPRPEAAGGRHARCRCRRGRSVPARPRSRCAAARPGGWRTARSRPVRPPTGRLVRCPCPPRAVAGGLPLQEVLVLAVSQRSEVGGRVAERPALATTADRSVDVHTDTPIRYPALRCRAVRA